MYSSVRLVFKHNKDVSNCIISYLGIKQRGPYSSLLFMNFINDTLTSQPVHFSLTFQFVLRKNEVVYLCTAEYINDIISNMGVE